MAGSGRHGFSTLFAAAAWARQSHPRGYASPGDKLRVPVSLRPLFSSSNARVTEHPWTSALGRGGASAHGKTRRRRSASRPRMFRSSSEMYRTRNCAGCSRHNLRARRRKSANGLRKLRRRRRSCVVLRELTRNKTASGPTNNSPAASSKAWTSFARRRNSARRGARNIALNTSEPQIG